MFTGIIESLGTVQEIKKDQDNVHITIESSITNELKIDGGFYRQKSLYRYRHWRNHQKNKFIRIKSWRQHQSGKSDEIRRSIGWTYCSRTR